MLYHYTNTSNAKSIQRSEIIRNNGKGVLLTTLKPEQYYRNEILQNNYGNDVRPDRQNRADYVCRVLINRIDANKLFEVKKEDGRHLYLYDGDIHINDYAVFDKPRCNRGQQLSFNQGIHEMRVYIHYKQWSKNL